MRLRAVLLAATLALPAVGLRAQQRPDSVRARPDTLGARPDTLRAPGDGVVRVDSSAKRRGAVKRAAPTRPSGFVVLPPISPRRAFLYSVLVPGLGQTRLQRPNVGAFFGTVELGAVVMARKTAYDVQEARQFAGDSVIVSYTVANGTVTPVYGENRFTSRLRARKSALEDWVALIIFNHLVAGADAFVAAQLWDLPAQVSVNPTRDGAQVALALRW